MSERSWTPGPWVIPSSNVFRVIALRDGEPYRLIVKDTFSEAAWYGMKFIGWPMDGSVAEEAAANARLIAAAPEMFELLETIDSGGGLIPADIWKQIRDVVVKVRGTDGR